MPEPSSPLAESSLLRAIGVLGLAAGIVNVTVGGGIFRLPADVARGLGAAAPLAYLVCAVAMILAVPRALFAFARDGFLPAPFASVHGRFHTPHVAIAAQSAIVCAFALTSTFERLVILANLAVLVLYALCCLAAWQLRRRDVRTNGAPFHVPAAASAPFFALLVIGWMLTGVQQDEWTALAAALAGATSVFFLTARSRRARQLPEMLSPVEEAR